MDEIRRISAIPPSMTTIETTRLHLKQSQMESQVMMGQALPTQKQEGAQRIAHLEKQKKKKQSETKNERRETYMIRQYQLALLFVRLHAATIEKVAQHLEKMSEIANKNLEIVRTSKSRQRRNKLFYLQKKEIEEIQHRGERYQEMLVEKSHHFIRASERDWRFSVNGQAFRFYTLNEMTDELAQLDLRITSSLRLQLFATETESERLSQSLIQIRMSVDTQEDNITEVRKELQSVNSQMKSKEKVHHYWAANLKNREEELRVTRVKIQRMEEIHPLVRKQVEYRGYLTKERLLAQEVQQLKENYEALTLELAEYQSEVDRLVAEVRAIQEILLPLKEDLATTRQEFMALKETQRELHDQVETMAISHVQNVKAVLEVHQVQIRQQLEELALAETTLEAAICRLLPAYTALKRDVLNWQSKRALLQTIVEEQQEGWKILQSHAIAINVFLVLSEGL